MQDRIVQSNSPSAEPAAHTKAPKKLIGSFINTPGLKKWLDNPAERLTLPVRLDYLLKLKKNCEFKDANAYWKQVKPQFTAKNNEDKVSFFLKMILSGNIKIRTAVDEVWAQYPVIRKEIMEFPEEKFESFISTVLRSRLKKLMKEVMESERATKYLESLQGNMPLSIKVLQYAFIGQSSVIVQQIWEKLFEDHLDKLDRKQSRNLKSILQNQTKNFLSPFRTQCLKKLRKACADFVDPEDDSIQSKEKRGRKRKNEDSASEEKADEASTDEASTDEASTGEALTDEALTGEALTDEALTSEALADEASEDEVVEQPVFFAPRDPAPSELDQDKSSVLLDEKRAAEELYLTEEELKSAMEALEKLPDEDKSKQTTPQPSSFRKIEGLENLKPHSIFRHDCHAPVAVGTFNRENSFERTSETDEQNLSTQDDSVLGYLI